MLMLGKCITSPEDQLIKISPDQLVQYMNGKNIAIVAQIENLRKVRTIDYNAYKNLKKTLPYFTIALFSPPLRKTENLLYSEYLIVDLDNLSNENDNFESLKQKVCNLNNVMLCFVSPSGNGLKVVFKLNKKIYDPAFYKTFYKCFAISFGKQLNLLQYIDTRACDITRATFLSYDNSIFYNKEAEPIIVDDYLTNDISKLPHINKEIKEIEKEILKNTEKETNNTLPDSVIEQIKRYLNPNYKPRQKCPYVPHKLNEVIPEILEKLSEINVNVEFVENIQYGKKIRINCDLRWAEVNIFYGKKGFSVVKTPKSGSDPELADVIASYIKQILRI